LEKGYLMENPNVKTEVRRLREKGVFESGLDLKFNDAKDVKTGILPQVSHSESEPFFRSQK
jgi:hypothetical protein